MARLVLDHSVAEVTVSSLPKPEILRPLRGAQVRRDPWRLTRRPSRDRDRPDPFDLGAPFFSGANHQMASLSMNEVASDLSRSGPSHRDQDMEPVHRIGITVMALLLVAAAGATAHHVYETHLSSGYAPILQAAMTSSYEERTAYIHEARVAVRTDKDREVEAKLEKMQEDLSDDMPPACKSLQNIAEDEQEKFNRAVEANQRGESGAQAIAMSASPIKANDAVRACLDADGKARRAEGGRLWVALCAIAGVPAI